MKILLSLAKRFTLLGVLVTRWLAYPSGVTEIVGSTLTLPSNYNNNHNHNNNNNNIYFYSANSTIQFSNALNNKYITRYVQ